MATEAEIDLALDAFVVKANEIAAEHDQPHHTLEEVKEHVGEEHFEWIRQAMGAAVKVVADRHWNVGFGLALAEAQRMHDNPVMIKDVMDAAGMTVKKLKQSGLEEYDLKVLRDALKF